MYQTRPRAIGANAEAAGDVEAAEQVESGVDCLEAMPSEEIQGLVETLGISVETLVVEVTVGELPVVEVVEVAVDNVYPLDNLKVSFFVNELSQTTHIYRKSIAMQIYIYIWTERFLF